MSRVSKQYRYFGENQPTNYPEDITRAQLLDGSAFQGETQTTRKKIYSLRIQGAPGTKFYINKGKVPALIGLSGVFYIDVSLGFVIDFLTFDESSIPVTGMLQGIIIDTIEEVV